MGLKRKHIELTGILKDKASIIKAVLTNKRTISSIKIAILRATTHTGSTSPPPELRLDTILSLGHDISPHACACIEAIMDRLHNTQNPCVALKCLFILHNIITNGSFILKEQLSFCPLTGGQNSLKLSRFRNKSNVENLELSQWVRWYASVLERNLITCRVLGCFFTSTSSSSKFHERKNKENVSKLLDFDFLNEIESLVCMVEGICGAPESLHYQKLDLVHELVLMVSEDYRYTQYQIMTRLDDLSDKVDKMSHDDSSELIRCLKRLEDCRMRLVEMFANRKRNDAFWDLIGQTKMKLEEQNEKRERGRVVVWKGTGFGERVTGTSQVIKLLPCRSQWSDIDRVQITVSAPLV